MGDKEGLPREAVLAILALAALLYTLGAWTVLAVRTGQESAIPFLSSEVGPASKAGGGSPAPKAPGGQAPAPAPSPALPPSQPPPSPPTSPSPAAVAPTITATLVISPSVTPSPSPRQASLGNFKAEVQNVELVTALERVAPRREGGVFIFVSLLVINGEGSRRLFGGEGTESSGVPPQEQVGVALRDIAGFESPAFATTPQPEAQKKWTPLPQAIDPQSQRQLTLAFDVPGDGGPFQLVLRAFPSRQEQRIQVEVPKAPVGGTATPIGPTAVPLATAALTATITPTAAAGLPTATAALPSPSPTATQAPGGPLLTGVGGPTSTPGPPSLTSPLGPSPSAEPVPR